MTNNRVICNAVKFSFEIPLEKITTMTTYTDGLTIMSGGKSYNFIFSDVERFNNLIKLNNEIEIRKKNNIQSDINYQGNKVGDVNTANHVSEDEIPKLLREYKVLLDEGIISEKEFQMKKEQFLLSKNLSNVSHHL